MPSIDRLRELLSPNCDLKDEELTLLAKQIQNLAELIVDLASNTLTRASVPEQPSSVEGSPYGIRTRRRATGAPRRSCNGRRRPLATDLDGHRLRQLQGEDRAGR